MRVSPLIMPTLRLKSGHAPVRETSLGEEQSEEVLAQNLILFSQLSWWCKLANVKSFCSLRFER